MGWLSTLFPSAKEPDKRSSALACQCSMPYVILDVETTGLDSVTDKIIQLSAIKYSAQGAPIDTYDTYLNPGVHIPSKITKITGITDATVRNAPTVEQVSKQFLSFISDLLLVGYNVTFDLRFLAAEVGDALSGREYVDVLSIARKYLYCADYKLSTVAEKCGFSPSGSFHNALTDCNAVAAVLSCLDVSIEDYSKIFIVSPPCQKAPATGFSAYPHSTDLKSIIPQKNFFDPQHPLFHKKIVFTGTLRMERADAAQLAVDVGAIVRSSVSSKTDFLVVGAQDINLVGEDGMSAKQEKAFALNQAGKAHIKIICENEFLQMVNKGALI